MTDLRDDNDEDLVEAEDAEITDPDVPPLGVFDEQVPTQDLAEVDADQLELNYHGEKRTVTGVVKIMRREGDEESADLLEHLAQLGQGVKKLADAVQQKRITGLHARPVLKKDDSKKP